MYRVSRGAFLGIVDGRTGFHKTQKTNAVLLTLVVHDVDACHKHLVAQGVVILREIQTRDDIQVRCFFIEDPGGYAIEVQSFLDPAVAAQFIE